MFHYGYFVICQNARLARAGDDWGPTIDSYKPGDALGIKNGVKATVVDVIKGQEAALNNVDVMVLIKEERSAGIDTMDWIKRVASRMAGARPRRMTSWPQIQAEFHGKRMRAVRNRIYPRPIEESFQDFLINHLLWFLGEAWFNDEMKKPPQERHVILRWRTERNEQLLKYDSPNRDKSKPLVAPITGSGKALLVLADDVLQLSQALDAPSKVRERLGSMQEFQGVRYEILVASIFARCGFKIGFIDDQTKRNPEFIASKGTERIAVEAKSRRRRGALHERGEFAADAPAEIKRLYESALGQNPGGIPFLVFIDVNLPLTPEVPAKEKEWVKEAMQAFDFRRREERVDPDTAIVLTNFGWHFSRDPNLPPGEFMITWRDKPEFEIKKATFDLLTRALNEYGLIIDEAKYSDGKEVKLGL